MLIGGRRRAGVTAVAVSFSSKVFVTFPIAANCAAAFFGDSYLINFYFFSNRRYYLIICSIPSKLRSRKRLTLYLEHLSDSLNQ
jgi:hypothetical protein